MRNLSSVCYILLHQFPSPAYAVGKTKREEERQRTRRTLPRSCGKIMCIRFVVNNDDYITGFNFDIDLTVWTHRVILEKDRFFIGILRPDGVYHSYHGVNRNGNTATLLYVHPAGKAKWASGKEQNPAGTIQISDLTEQFIRGNLTFDEVSGLLEKKEVIYAPDASMQALLSDASGRVMILEPGSGYRIERRRYSLLSNYSILDPASTKPFLVPGDDRYERAERRLENDTERFSVKDALSLLYDVRQEGVWATRVSFVYSGNAGTVTWVENNRFDRRREYRFPSAETAHHKELVCNAPERRPARTVDSCQRMADAILL